MKACFRVLTLMIAVVFAFAGCQSDPEPSHPLDALDIPKTGYEQYFAPVVSATLYVGRDQQQIQPDDPRILRLLNFLAYSADTMQDSWTRGVYSEEEIALYYSSGATMLEVTFAADSEDWSQNHCVPKILVCGDTYLLYLRNGKTAERHWPYAKQAPESAQKSDTDVDWGGEYWLDILEYCGF